MVQLHTRWKIHLATSQKNQEKLFYPQQKKRKWNVDPKKFVSVRSKGSLKTVHCFCSGENNPVKGSKQLRHTKMAMFFMGIEEAVSYQKMTK